MSVKTTVRGTYENKQVDRNSMKRAHFADTVNSEENVHKNLRNIELHLFSHSFLIYHLI